MKRKDREIKSKKVMQMKTIAHHQLADTQPVPEQWPPHQPSP